MTTRKELIEALRVRYRSAAFGDKIKILDEFVAVTGYHRKRAIRLLWGEESTVKAACARNRLYGEAGASRPAGCGHVGDAPAAQRRSLRP